MPTLNKISEKDYKQLGIKQLEGTKIDAVYKSENDIIQKAYYVDQAIELQDVIDGFTELKMSKSINKINIIDNFVVNSKNNQLFFNIVKVDNQFNITTVQIYYKTDKLYCLTIATQSAIPAKKSELILLPIVKECLKSLL